MISNPFFTGISIYSICNLAYQVLGSIVGVKLIRQVFPKVGYGARLNAGIHHGVLAEGLATFVVVMVSLMLTKKEMKSFFMKTWISSISKMTLHILSSDLTGGIMNPASVRAFPYFVPNVIYLFLVHVVIFRSGNLTNLGCKV